MSTLDKEPEGIAGHVYRALSHAEGAIRCYLVLLAAEIEHRWPRMLRQAVWMVALVGVGLIGIALVGVGVARYLEARIDIPGIGGIIVGGVMVAICLVIMLRRKGKKERHTP